MSIKIIAPSKNTTARASDTQIQACPWIVDEPSGIHRQTKR